MRLPGFTPDQRYFAMFTGLAVRVVTASDLLSKMFDDPGRVGELVPRIKDVEHEADRLMHELDERLEGAFITPMDREDIHTLAYRLDNVIDIIDGTARRVVLFHIDGPVPGHARQLAEVVARAGARLAESVRDIRKEKALSMHLRSVKQLEEEGDALYHDGVAALFAGGQDPLDVIKWKELYDRLEEAVDECEHTAQVVQSVALKYGGFTRGG
jgi:uncharacterized protein